MATVVERKGLAALVTGAGFALTVAPCLGGGIFLYGHAQFSDLMNNYDVYATESFKKLFLTLDKSEQIWIGKMKKQLEEYPTGKPLRFDWFREKKHLNKRLYFLVYGERKRILFVAFASKKDQQKVIDFVIANKDEFFNYLRSF